jgi:hypothetical protein
MPPGVDWNNQTRSASVRIKRGLTVLSTLSAMLLSVVMISGCNEEPASTTPAGGAGAGKPAEKTPAPTPPKDEAKPKM